MSTSIKIALFRITLNGVGVYMWEFNFVGALTHIQKPLGYQVQDIIGLVHAKVKTKQV